MNSLLLPGPEGPGFKRDRSASLAWVDFLTAPSETTPYPSDDEDGDFKVPVYDHTSIKKQSPGRVDDDIFYSYADENTGKILVGKFLAMLESNGLKRSDVRLQEMFVSLRRILREEEVSHRGHLNDDFVGSIETLQLDRDAFRELIIPNIIVISSAFRNQFVIPKFDTFCHQIEDLYNECKEVNSGKVAPYLNKLAKIDPNCWGVSVCTIDGQRYSVGDTNIPVTLHALSKPMMFGYCLHEIPKETVHQYVGQEPSGHMFNELVLDQKKRPHNPMINAGSIMVHALLQKYLNPDMSSAERFDSTLELFTQLSGGEYIGFNNGMFLSKRQAADRNWALGHYMKEHNCFPPGVDLADSMEYYLQTSSLETTVEVLSVIASTFANGGVCPITGIRVLREDVVADVLSVMFSCGMLEFSGKFGFRVGLPAKSCISGAILLIIPNVCGMALWSPPLDTFSNSVRGLTFCEKLVQTFNFHCFDATGANKIDPTKKNVETKGSNIITLMFSAAKGDLDSIFRLHLYGINMALYDCDERTALHLAACEGHYDVAEYLLRQCGVPHEQRDRWGNTPYDEAVTFGHMKIAELLRNWHPARRSFSHSFIPTPNMEIIEATTDESAESDN